MDENKKNVNGEDIAENTENTQSTVDSAGTEVAADTDTKPENKKKKKSDKAKKDGLIKRLKAARSGKLKNQALFRRGGYSIAITALVLAVLILFNWLVATLSDRFNLEFDMSSQKVNTISAENLDYIEKIDTPVTITVCGDENNYVNYISYYAQNLYNATGDSATDYYKQTLKLVSKYADYNDNITVRFIDPQSTEFTEISTKYSTDNLAYGDIIVSSTKKTEDGTENERHKKIGFKDIYALSDENGYASYGYGSYTVSGNNIETCLTSAIAYVTSSVSKKVALLTGHSASDYTATYVSLLKDNNYTVETIGDAMISSVPDDYDLVAIVAPSIDFLGSELDAISSFLDNSGNLGKGLLFFADATCPALPNLYDFLSEWGIKVNEGILFETNSSNHVADDPTTMGIYPAEDSITTGMKYCICGYNVPITEGEPADSGISVTGLMATDETVVSAPVGTAKDWTGYSSKDAGKYLGVVQAAKEDYNDDNEKITSYVMAFSSIEYIYSDWTEYTQLSNKNIALAVADRAAGVEDSGISFVSKTIANESYSDSVTASGSLAIRVIFMIAIPILVIIAGIYIFIRRKNA